MTKGKNGKPDNMIILDPNPKGELKPVTGSEHDDWSLRLVNLVAAALPDQRNADTVSKAINEVCAGMLDMKPADPVEGILISKIFVVSEAALRLYRLAWAQPPEYFDARLKYLTQADKASRTLAMLTERLDHHRNRGQQKIVVQHTTTVNADQALIADNIVAARAPDREAVKLVAADRNKPMEIIEPSPKKATPVEGGGSKSK